MTRILVVDDDEDTAEWLMWIVKGQGWEADTAYSGAEAICKVQEGNWDAVIMDIRMSKLYGPEALKQMRAHTPDLPVVLFTVQAAQGDMLEAFRSGAGAGLFEPLTYEKVVKALNEAMTRSKGRASVAELPSPETKSAAVDPDKRTRIAGMVATGTQLSGRVELEACVCARLNARSGELRG